MGMSVKRALHIAIDLIEQQPKTQKNQEAQKVLENLTSKEYFVHWDRGVITSTIQKWIDNHNRMPTVRDLSEPGMPKAVTIQKHFGLSASVYLKQQFGHLFPEQEKRNKYGFTDQEDWLQCFRHQFLKHGRINSKKYNLVKDDGTPKWETIVRHSGANGWRDLMDKANVSYEKSTAQANKIRVRKSTFKYLDRYKRIIKELEEL